MRITINMDGVQFNTLYNINGKCITIQKLKLRYSIPSSPMSSLPSSLSSSPEIKATHQRGRERPRRPSLGRLTDQRTRGRIDFLWFGGWLKSGGWDEVQLGKSPNIGVSSYDTANS
jgi:hypothetical protein